MFKVNNKDTPELRQPYFTSCSSVSIVNFEHVITDWVTSSFSVFRKILNYC